jgi:shikimate 5-dehydrogenase
MDTVYRPLETPLLRAARDAGLPTVDGVAMFVRQAEAQSALWTGRPPPPGLMDRVVRARLKADSVTS